MYRIILVFYMEGVGSQGMGRNSEETEHKTMREGVSEVGTVRL